MGRLAYLPRDFSWHDAILLEGTMVIVEVALE